MKARQNRQHGYRLWAAVSWPLRLRTQQQIEKLLNPINTSKYLSKFKSSSQHSKRVKKSTLYLPKSRFLRDMKLYLIFLIIFTGGCASPSIEFPSTPEGIHEAESVKYSVFTSGEKVQVIRTGFLPFSRHDEAIPQMILAVKKITGCKLRPKGLKADPAVLTGFLDC